jgi:hypothetical protein
MPRSYRPWVAPYGDDDFEWDQAKSLATFGDRDLVFEAARIVMRGPLLRTQDRRRDYGELRYMVLGELYGRVIMIVYTPRRGKCRIISLRPATSLERRIYDEHRSS